MEIMMAEWCPGYSAGLSLSNCLFSNHRVDTIAHAGQWTLSLDFLSLEVSWPCSLQHWNWFLKYFLLRDTSFRMMENNGPKSYDKVEHNRTVNHHSHGVYVNTISLSCAAQSQEFAEALAHGTCLKKVSGF